MVKTSGTVLLVDPDADTRTAARDALRRSGYETREVETGADAVESARSGGIAIVLLEVSLPDVTGYEICRDLRIDHGEFGTIVDALSHELKARPAQSDWTDLTLFIARPAGDA